jgi:hypothetical protein
MNEIIVQGSVDEQHRLTAIVPESVPPGQVTISVSTVQEDDAGAAWMAGICQQWSEDLSDGRQDIYSLEDGEAIDPAK